MVGRNIMVDGCAEQSCLAGGGWLRSTGNSVRGEGEGGRPGTPRSVLHQSPRRVPNQLLRLTLGALTTQHPKREVSPAGGKESCFVSKYDYDSKVIVKHTKFGAK